MKPKGYWSKINCEIVAKQCQTKKELKNNFVGAYNKMIKNKWIDELCSHMKSLSNNFKRIIYAYEFPDNHVYVGLTFNPLDRNKKHSQKGPVFNHCIRTNITIPNQLILSDFLNEQDAVQTEAAMIQKYINNGWKVLNISKAGGLGGYLKWTKEKCSTAAKECITKNEFRIKYPGAHKASKLNGWFDDICSHMSMLQHPPYTKTDCQKEALNYLSRTEFQKKSNSIYCAAWRNLWLDEICSHMTQKIKPVKYWDYGRCKQEALKYITKNEFRVKSNGAYCSARRNLWLNEICSHMIAPTKEGKSVIQLTLNNEEIKIFESLTDASIETGAEISNIIRACKKKLTAKGFKWKYK